VDPQTFVHLIHRYYPFKGGSESYFQALSERLASGGHHVQVITTDAWDLEYFWNPTKRRVEVSYERHNGVEIYRTPARHLPLANFSHRAIRRGMGELSRVPVPGRKRVLRSLSRFGPWLPELPALLERVASDASLIHAGNIALESLIRESSRFARARDIPFMITPKLRLGENEHSPERRYYTMPHQIELLRGADMVMTQTSVEADFLAEKGVEPERLRVVGLGIDVKDVTGGDAQRVRDTLGISGPFILSLGAAAYDKGTIHACEAVIRLNQRRAEPVTIVIAGPIMSEFQQYIDTLTSDQRQQIRVLGYVDDETRTDLLAGCDLLTLASRTEAFGYVFLEAWANAKPVIGARAGGIPAVVDDGVDGLLVPFGDIDALSDAISTILEDSEFARRLGTSGQRTKVVDTEDWYRKVRAVYDEVLGVKSNVSDAEGAVDGPAVVSSL
jgi:glycosyltransferase involved in cell wall biosynthesis